MTNDLTISQQSAILGVTQRRGYQLKADEGMPSDPREFGRWLRGREDASSAKLDAAEQRARVDRERADKLQMENAATRRELIPASEVEQVVSTAFAAIASDIKAIPDGIERRHGISPELAELVETALLDAMDSLADRLSVFASVGDTGAG